MVSVENYAQFGGYHWETGSLRNVLAHMGVTNPHTGEPYTEATLLGLSGGIAVMYFAFEYEGQPPHVAIGMRNPFDPIDAAIQRLGLIPDWNETTSQKRAVDNLLSALATNQPPIVWADMFRLRYNALPESAFTAMRPIVVFDYNSDTGIVQIADRAGVPITSTPGEIQEARAAQGNFKNRLLVIEQPDEEERKEAEEIADALRDAIAFCVELYTGKPPRGSAGNFGATGLEKWARMTNNKRNNKGWHRLFEQPEHLYDALKSVYTAIEHTGTGGAGSRHLYAQFLEGAAGTLGNDTLLDVAEQFQTAGELWTQAAYAALPDNVDALVETRTLIAQRDALFRELGDEALPEMDQLAVRLNTLKQQVAADFPLDEAGREALLDNLRDRLEEVAKVEGIAFDALADSL